MGILDQLGLDPVKLAIQAFNFLLLLYLLNRFAYRPVVGMFDARASRIRSDLESAQAMREEAERDRVTHRNQLNKARDEARAIIEEANTVAARLREQALIDAEATVAQTLSRGRDEIAREREMAVAELRRDVANVAILAASRVIERNLDTADSRRLIDDALKGIEVN
jgi:F-type H+-transporting ATPase subunit b